MQSETVRGSADGNVGETLSAAQNRPCARRRGHRGGRGRDRDHLPDGRLYYRGIPAWTSAGHCLRLCRIGGGRPCPLRPVSACPRLGCRSHLFFSVCHCCSLSVVCHHDKPVVCPSPRLLDGPWARRATLGLGCVCDRLGRRDGCGTWTHHQSYGTFCMSLVKESAVALSGGGSDSGECVEK